MNVRFGLVAAVVASVGMGGTLSRVVGQSAQTGELRVGPTSTVELLPSGSRGMPLLGTTEEVLQPLPQQDGQRAVLVSPATTRLVMEFTTDKTEFKFPVGELNSVRRVWQPDDLFAENPPLPSDWSPYNFLILEFRASSSERFHLQIFANDGENNKEVMVAKRISPFQNAWVKAAIPLDFFRKPAREGFDLAATFNKPRHSYWININFGGWAPCKNVTALGFEMSTPLGSNGNPPKIEIRSISLAKEDPGDQVLDPRVVVDSFGQWIPADWPAKAKSLEDLQKAWAAEAAALNATKPPFPQDKFGGYANTPVPAPPGTQNGFFRLAQIDGKWWLITPEGNRFFSTGFNGIGTSSGTPTANRTYIFESLATQPPQPPAQPPTTQGARGGRGRGGGAAAGSFYTTNLQRRYGNDFQQPWGELTFKRLDAWGINTVAGFGNSPPNNITFNGNKKPYTIMLRNWAGGGGGGGGGTTIMGMPDVYAADFPDRVNQVAQQQCAPLKDDPYLLGYFVGNEPPWPGRESLLVDAILAGPETVLKARLTEALGPGDTLERRRDFVYEAFDHYLATINAAIKRHDPNHLNLGIRLGGEVTDEVIKACRGFDVCSINVYDFAIARETLDRFATLTGRPLIVGEFHFGAPERGLSGGLRQVANQTERGVAYQHYVENAAAHPAMLGTHWFQFIDQPATGRNDGENYNIGIVDVTDRPYDELAAALARTHARLHDIHAGKLPPSTQKPMGASTAEIHIPNPTMIPPAH